MCPWLEDQGCPCNELEAAEAAARGGHLAVVRWLLARVRQQQQDEQQQQQDEQQQQQQDEQQQQGRAAAAGSPPPQDGSAARRSLPPPALLADDDVTFDKQAPITAARGGHVGLTEWLLQLLLLPRLPRNVGGGSWCQVASRWLLTAAVHGFELPALQRLHTTLQQHSAARGDPDPGPLRSIDLEDSLLLEALNSPTHDWRDKVLLQLTPGDGDAMVMAVGVAIRAGDLQLLQSLRHRVPGWLRDFGAELAAEEGHLELLHQMAAWGWHWLVGPEAGRGGMPVLLSGAHDLMDEAAARGRVEVLEWMRAQGCSFNGESIFAAAASYGNVALLERLAGWGCLLEDRPALGAPRAATGTVSPGP
ncbi:hypothetical protein PLESTF_001058400 [Pleodorina starrii]|nr:hypothetical protein PLESTF_001058400 [Pleodorina starrii]